MNLTEFQNSKIELAKLVLNIEEETLLRKLRILLENGEMGLKTNPTSKMKEEFPNKQSYKKREVLRGGIEDSKNERTISMDEFAIKLSISN